MQRRFEIGAAIVLEAFALLGLFVGRSLPFGSVARPGPGLFPLTLLVLLAIGGAVLLGTALASPPAPGGPLVFRWKKPALVLAVLLLYAAVLERIGFVPATVLVVVVLLRIVEGLGWVATLVSAILVALSVYYLFHVLGVRLPPAPWTL